MTTLGSLGTARTLECDNLIVKNRQVTVGTKEIILKGDNGEDLWSISYDAENNFTLINEVLDPKVISIQASIDNGDVFVKGGGVGALTDLTDVSTNNIDGSIMYFDSTDNTYKFTSSTLGIIRTSGGGNFLKSNTLQTNFIKSVVGNIEFSTHDGAGAKYIDFSNNIISARNSGLGSLTELKLNGSTIELDNITFTGDSSIQNRALPSWVPTVNPNYLSGNGVFNNHLVKVVNGVSSNTFLQESAVISQSTTLKMLIQGTLIGVYTAALKTEYYETSKTRIHLFVPSSGAENTDDGITITSDKRVGIGVIVPEEDLDVNGTIQLSNTSEVQLKFKKQVIPDVSIAHDLAEISSIAEGTNGGILKFSTKTDGASAVNEKFRINSDGAFSFGNGSFGGVGQVIKSQGASNIPVWDDETDTTYTQGTGVAISGSNVISIGQSVATNQTPNFQNLKLIGTNTPALHLERTGSQSYRIVNDNSELKFQAYTGGNTNYGNIYGFFGASPNHRFYQNTQINADLSVTGKLGVNGSGSINYGNSGQVLKSQGSSSAPIWANDTDTTYTQGTGVAISGSNVISIGQSVATNQIPSFQCLKLIHSTQPFLDLQRATGGGSYRFINDSAVYRLQAYVTGASPTYTNVYGFFGIANGMPHRFIGNTAITGNLVVTGTYPGSSDDRLKSYETPIENATSVLLQLRPFKYKKHPKLVTENPTPDLSGVDWFYESGFIAQEVAKIPELNYLIGDLPVTDEDAPPVEPPLKSLTYTNFIMWLVAGFQEQQMVINSQATEIATLKQAVNQLLSLSNLTNI